MDKDIIKDHCNDSFAPLTVSGVLPQFAAKCSVGAMPKTSISLENDGIVYGS